MTRKNFMFSDTLLARFIRFCIDKGLSEAEVIRTSLSDFLDKQGY